MADLNQPEELLDPAPADGQAAPDGGMSALDRIGIEAQGLENDAQAVEDKILNGGEEPAPVVDPALAWAQMMMMAGGFVSMALPELRDVYTEAACMNWGAGMAAVAGKYGWDAGDTMAKWAPECALIMASVPLLIPTVRAVKTRQAAKKAKPLNKAPKRDESAAKDGLHATDVPTNPMHQEPGGFSVPT